MYAFLNAKLHLGQREAIRVEKRRADNFVQGISDELMRLKWSPIG